MTRRADVLATYDRIAGHFAETRPEPWPEVERFLEGRSARVALDIGTGNGRHAELLGSCAQRVLAVDLSRAALDTALARAAERGYAVEPLQVDAAGLPFLASAVDLAVYIATLHHLPTRELRVRSLDELARVLVPSGTALVSAWSVSHGRFDESSGFDTTIDWTLPDGETVGRFYHIYDLGEFEADIVASGLDVVDAFESSGNCFAVVTSRGS